MPHASTPACPVCQGEGILLGSLGASTWFRCRQCGIDFHRAQPRRQRPPAHETPRNVP
ncbi:hypothetical protein [Achromobacter pulmonis]|uniref:hypothetical protein n=1 Tax=Achromobacter pulmonis TaxID=1389932 RepID=UPI0015E831CE|nr:hypothetical protein [Achromobacter pulmonis]